MFFDKTNEKVNDMIKDGCIPGASYAFINRMQIEKHVQGNKQTKPAEEPLQPNQQYDIASLTKVVGTVPVIIQLLQDGRIHLDDSVSDYLRTFKHPEVTIRNLITHTSGIEGWIPDRDDLDNNELREALVNLDVNEDKLNKEMEYSDVNFIFLGWIAGLVMNLPVQPLIQQMVLNPLGLNDTTFHPDERRTVPTSYDEETHTNLNGHVHDPKAQVLGDDCGSAGMFSTLEDLSRFVQYMLQVDKTKTLFTPYSFEALYDDQTPMQDGSRSFGWARDEFEGHPYLWQAGYTGTFIVLVRELQNGFVFLSNRVHPTVSEQFMDDRADLIDTYLDELFN